MDFEFDPEKSRLNRLKHKIDFNQAQELWEGPYVEFAAKGAYENRYALIGPIGNKLYTCIFTFRAGKIRIISCRSARDKEKKLYEKSLK